MRLSDYYTQAPAPESPSCPRLREFAKDVQKIQLDPDYAKVNVIGSAAKAYDVLSCQGPMFKV